jgi:hypothetical protein
MFHPKHVEQLAGNKNTVQKFYLVGTFLELIHDARNDKHKKKEGSRIRKKVPVQFELTSSASEQ